MESENENLESGLKILFVVAAVAALIVASVYFFHNRGEISGDHTRWGEFGDFFGGTLNPIFGFIGLIALLLTITLQAKELRLTRKELANSSTALQSQNDTLQKNNFENSFFQLLRLHNEIVDSIDLVKGGGRPYAKAAPSAVVTTKGRDCFRVFLYRLSEAYEDLKNLNNEPETRYASEKELIIDAYVNFYSEHNDELGHYSRYLYNVFKFVHNSDIENKKFYSNLVRAQLSDSELALLHYNSLSKYGSEKFLPLLKEYKVLKNMPDSVLFHESHCLMGALATASNGS